jgi:peptidoglycan/LPS O-acetylase OafA/YrhL
VDVLRGISILSVVLLHIRLRLLFAHKSLSLVLPARVHHLLFENAVDGVPIFFAISGFLITYTCLRRFGSLRNMSARVFYRIRFARIAPLLLLVLGVLSALHLAHISAFVIPASRSTLPRALLAALTFHLNWLEGMHGYLPAAWDVLWSLSVEEMFYVFFPLACLLLLRWRGGKYAFGALMLSLMIMGPFARTVWTATNLIWQEKSYLGGTDCIAFGVATALLLGWCERTNKRPSDRTLLGIVWSGAIVMVVLILPYRLPWSQLLGRSGTWNTVMILGVCAVIFGTVVRNRAGRMWSAPLRWFGRQSYEVYMTHEFVVILMTELAVRLAITRGRYLLLWAFATLLLTAPLGWLVATYFSEPMNRRLRGARPPQPAPAH